MGNDLSNVLPKSSLASDVKATSTADCYECRFVDHIFRGFWLIILIVLLVVIVLSRYVLTDSCEDAQLV